MVGYCVSVRGCLFVGYLNGWFSVVCLLWCLLGLLTLVVISWLWCYLLLFACLFVLW